MNGYFWRVIIVPQDSPYLVDRTNRPRIATTDTNDLCVYLSNELSGEFALRVFLHELSHCAMWSYDLLDEIHRFVKSDYWIEAEEWICNFIADYGAIIFRTAYSTMGYDAWKVVPIEIEKLVA